MDDESYLYGKALAYFDARTLLIGCWHLPSDDQFCRRVALISG